MKNLLYFLTILLISFGCKTEKTLQKNETHTKTNDFAIIIHGGAGTILKKNMTDETEAAYKVKLEEAIKVGHTILKKGGTSQEAVMKTIQIMEESPLFNAGKGSLAKRKRSLSTTT